MILSYTFRLWPTRAQHETLDRALWHTRELYNAALEERIDAYKKAKVNISWYSQCRGLTELRSGGAEWTTYSVSLQRWPLKQIDLAFRAFFSRLKAGKKPGYPRFKGRPSFKTFGFSSSDGWKLRGKYLVAKGLGAIRVHLHRDLPSPAMSCKVKREGRKWFVIFTAESQCEDHHDGPEVGIDVGVSSLVTLSTGEMLENARLADRHSRKLRTAQRALARAQRGSRNRLKAKARCAAMRAKESAARLTRLHQITADLTRRFSRIVVERLAIKDMVRSAAGTVEEPGKNVAQKSGLNRSIHDAAWGRLKQMLVYKAERAGGRIIEVNPRNTSQACSGCGVIVPKDLKQRVHDCPHCGLILDRDHNAARNILALAAVAGRGALNLGSAWDEHGNSLGNERDATQPAMGRS